jgi:CRP-like cAMP-binding protein
VCRQAAGGSTSGGEFTASSPNRDRIDPNEDCAVRAPVLVLNGMDGQRLAAIPLFSELSGEELSALAAVAGEKEVEPGTKLTAEGDFGHCVYAIEEGTADVSCAGETIGTVERGDVVGEVAVLASGRRSATVVATTPMRLISFFKSDVWALEREAPEAARRLRELLDDRTHPASSVAPADE